MISSNNLKSVNSRPHPKLIGFISSSWTLLLLFNVGGEGCKDYLYIYDARTISLFGGSYVSHNLHTVRPVMVRQLYTFALIPANIMVVKEQHASGRHWSLFRGRARGGSGLLSYIVHLNVGAPAGLASGGPWMAFWRPVAQILP